MEMARRTYTQADLRAVVSELAPGWGDRIRLSPEPGNRRSSQAGRVPDLIVSPFSNEEVVQVVRLCARYKIPLLPFGAGLSLEADRQAVQGGVAVDLSEMNRVLEVNSHDLDCRVQAGLSAEQLNLDLRYENLFFPLNAATNATLGGMAAARASATNSVRYGSMRSAVIGLTVVTASGEVIRVGGRCRKDAAGYDLTALFVGAEGTLGIITEVQLRLFRRPAQSRTAICSFEHLEDAVNAVMSADRRGIQLARIELLDQLQMDASIRYGGLSGFPLAPTLFLEFQGSQAEVTEQVIAITDVLAEFNGSNFQWAAGESQTAALWQARRDAFTAARALNRTAAVMVNHICVPLSHLAQVLLYAQNLARESGLLCPVVGHVGDGCFHMQVLYDADDKVQSQQAQALSDALISKALAIEGICSQDRGAGKEHYLATDQSNALDTMKLIKCSLDPDNIMNPGKLLDI